MYQYPGFPPFIDRAAEALKVSVPVADRARTEKLLHLLSNLVAGAAEPSLSKEQRSDIMVHATVFRDALAVSMVAAEVILAEARAAFDLEWMPMKMVPTVLSDQLIDAAKEESMDKAGELHARTEECISSRLRIERLCIEAAGLRDQVKELTEAAAADFAPPAEEVAPYEVAEASEDEVPAGLPVDALQEAAETAVAGRSKKSKRGAN